MIRIIW